jgi:hypothetical protein
MNNIRQLRVKANVADFLRRAIPLSLQAKRPPKLVAKATIFSNSKFSNPRASANGDRAPTMWSIAERSA